MKKSTISCHELTTISENYASNFRKKLMLLLFLSFATIGVFAQDVPTCVAMSVSPAISCPNTVATATAQVVNIVSPQPVSWVISPNLSGATFVDNGLTTLPAIYSADGPVSTTINVGPNPGFGFTVVLQFDNFASIQTCSASPIVIQPSCNITGNDEVCPLTTNTYTSTLSAGSGEATHLWTVVSGVATINGSNTGSSVSVTASSSCGPVTLRDEITRNGCQNSCEKTFNVVSSNPVIIVDASPTDGILGCNPTREAVMAALGTATASNNCGPVSPTFTDAAVVIDGCSRSLTRTWNAIDACGNPAEAVSRTVTYTVDVTAPVIIVDASPTDGILGCNPTREAVMAALGTATATDDCGRVVPTFTDAAVVIDGCSRSLTRTWNAIDACGNPAEAVSRTVTYTVDVTAPVINCSLNKIIACDAEVVFDTPTATDNCNGIPIIVIVSTSNDGLTRTWKATDACGNESTCSQTITVSSCEGCTLGYWKNHTDRWCSTYSTNMLFGDVFENAPSNLANLTLLQALNLGGGGIYNLARQAVAALLNTCSDEVDYPMPYAGNSQSLIDAVNAAYLAGEKASGKLASELDILNNTGCPLGGTSASPSPKEGQSNHGQGNHNGNNNSKKEAAGFTASPVPFKDQLTIKYDFDYQSDVKIEVFNAQGNKVLSKADTNSYLNKEVRLNLDVNRGQEQVYIVKLTTNQGSSTRKVMSAR
jgi:hypothetical protein